jgi:hypothetical protein
MKNNWSFNEIKIAPMRIASLILLIIAWSAGTVHGILAWILLLLIVDIQGTFTPKNR